MQELLDKWGIKINYNTILSMWNESHRFYHNQNHLLDLINQINENKTFFSEKEYEMLLITSLFHDCIYDPTSQENEEKSADFFINCCSDKSNPDILKIKQMIIDTKSHNTSDKLSSKFNEFDMKIVERNYDQLLEWENGIHEEYKIYGNDLYKKGRLSFLESIIDKYPKNMNNLLQLIDYVKSNY